MVAQNIVKNTLGVNTNDNKDGLKKSVTLVKPGLSKLAAKKRVRTLHPTVTAMCTQISERLPCFRKRIKKPVGDNGKPSYPDGTTLSLSCIINIVDCLYSDEMDDTVKLDKKLDQKNDKTETDKLKYVSAWIEQLLRTNNACGDGQHIPGIINREEMRPMMTALRHAKNIEDAVACFKSAVRQ